MLVNAAAFGVNQNQAGASLANNLRHRSSVYNFLLSYQAVKLAMMILKAPKSNTTAIFQAQELPFQEEKIQTSLNSGAVFTGLKFGVRARRKLPARNVIA